MYEYRARARRVIDGDTLEITIDLGFGVHTDQTIRLDGIDTAELKAHDSAERERALLAAQRLRELVIIATPPTVAVSWPLVVRTTPDIRGVDRTDSLGRRYVAKIWVSGRPDEVGETLLAEGLAVRWVAT